MEGKTKVKQRTARRKDGCPDYVDGIRGFFILSFIEDDMTEILSQKSKIKLAYMDGVITKKEMKKKIKKIKTNK